VKRTAFLAAVITVALSAPLALPTASADDLGTGTLTGTVVELVRETPSHSGPDESGEGDQHELVLATADGVVPLSTDGAQPTPGERVTVEVRPDGDAVRIVDVVSSRAARAAAVPADIEREVYVAIVAPKGYDVEDNTNTVASVRRSLDKASSYWSSQTGGIIRFSYAGTVAPYVSTHACGDTTDMWSEAVRRFADSGVSVRGVGKYLVVVGPNGSSVDDKCDYGLGTLGALDAPWNAIFVSDTSQSLYAHELGHNLGLAHANALRCDGLQDGLWDGSTFGSECARWRYEDMLDVMGYSGETYGEGNLNAPHLDDLGLDPTAIQTVTGPTTVTIPPLSSTTAPGRGLKVTDSTGADYFVEYRTATGRDAIAAINPYHPTLGVLLYREDPAAYRRHGSYHLDATPGRRDDYDYDRALRPGLTFTSASGSLTITTISQDAGGAVVQINGGAVTDPEPVLSPATVTLTGPSRARRNGTVRLTARVLSASDLAVPDVDVAFQRRANGRWVTVATATTKANGVAKARVKLRRSSTFRAATGEPATYSGKTAVRSRTAKNKR
jgi:hypothetical protein